LTFVRHGSTQWNALQRFQGQTEIPLDATGLAQAQALAALLRDEDFDHAVSSDLARAYDTARAIRGQAPVQRDARWREFRFGEWEGLTWDEIVARWPHLREHDASAAKRYTPEGGESFEDVCARVAQALDDLQRARHRHVLVVTHAGPLHAMLQTLFGEMSLRFSPASVTRVRIEDGHAELLALNEVAHLPVQ